MATLTVQSVSKTGLTPVYSNATATGSGGDKLKPGDNTFIHVKNGGGASITVSVDDIKTAAPDGYTSFNPDLAVVIQPGSERMIGPLPASRFNNTDNLVHVTYTSVTSVTVAAIRT